MHKTGYRAAKLALEKHENERRGYVIRQVGYHRVRLAYQHVDRFYTELGHVVAHKLNVVEAVERFREYREKLRVYLERVELFAPLGYGARKSARARADLDDGRAVGAARLGDLVEQFVVENEVLPERFFVFESVFYENALVIHHGMIISQTAK